MMIPSWVPHVHVWKRAKCVNGIWGIYNIEWCRLCGKVGPGDETQANIERYLTQSATAPTQSGHA